MGRGPESLDDRCMDNATWTPPPPVYPYAPPQGAQTSQVIGRSFALLCAPFPMIWGGAFAASVAGWVGFFVGFAAVGILIGCAMASTHAIADRRPVAAAYAFGCLVWGAAVFAVIYAILDAMAKAFNASV
jgi:hypothetical protein